MKITGFRPDSFQDWDAGLTSVVYTNGCNYSCPSCHAKKSFNYSSDNLFNLIERKRKYVSRVVFCGGEPTLQHDLRDAAKRLKASGLSVKLDTNGSHPEVLQELLEDKTIDYVAMDIKGPASLYRQLIGFDDSRRFDLREYVEKSIGLVQLFPDYEFRTTIVPVLRANGEMSFFTQDEADEMGAWVSGFVSGEKDKVKWFMQQFVARGKEEMVDERWAKENLNVSLQRTPQDVLIRTKDCVGKYFPRCVVR